MNKKNKKRIITKSFSSLFVIICLVLLVGCDPEIKPEDPTSPDPLIPEQVTCTYQWTIDEDCDRLSNDTENNPTNISEHGFKDYEYNEDPSTAEGDFNDGSLTGGINLIDDGDNHFHYYGTDDTDKDDWGTGKLLWVLAVVGEELRDISTHYNSQSDFDGPIQFGDLSLKNGGNFCWLENGVEKCHTSHQNGTDVDLRYVNKNWTFGENERVNIVNNPENYDILATLNLFLAFEEVASDINLLICNVDALGFDPEDFVSFTILHDAGHSDHMHLRVNKPTD